MEISVLYASFVPERIISMPGHVEDGLAFLRRFFVLTDVLKVVGRYYTYSQNEMSEI